MSEPTSAADSAITSVNPRSRGKDHATLTAILKRRRVLAASAARKKKSPPPPPKLPETVACAPLSCTGFLAGLGEMETMAFTALYSKTPDERNQILAELAQSNCYNRLHQLASHLQSEHIAALIRQMSAPTYQPPK